MRRAKYLVFLLAALLPLGLHAATRATGGIAWKLSRNLYLTLEYGYIGWTSVAGLALRLSL